MDGNVHEVLSVNAYTGKGADSVRKVNVCPDSCTDMKADMKCKSEKDTGSGSSLESDSGTGEESERCTNADVNENVNEESETKAIAVGTADEG